MRRPHRLLLHVLLSLALVANGIGAAMASAHAGCAHSSAVVALSVADPSATGPAPSEPPCHDDMAPEAFSSLGDNAHRNVPEDAVSTGAHGEDQHCDSACACDCTAHCQAALMPQPLLLHVSARIAHADTPVYDHAAPTLPHPVRPPIG